MAKDPFEERRKSFEEQYFQKKDAQLVDRLKAVFLKKIDKESIRQTTGITDERLLDDLAEMGLSGELISAFKLYPLVEVAWADGKVDRREIRAVLDAVERYSVQKGSSAFRMLENALENGPRHDSRKLWYLYAEELRKVLNPKELETFRNDLLDAARQVAQASGGIVNLAFTIDGNEKKVLDAILRALTPE